MPQGLLTLSFSSWLYHSLPAYTLSLCCSIYCVLLFLWAQSSKAFAKQDALFMRIDFSHIWTFIQEVTYIFILKVPKLGCKINLRCHDMIDKIVQNRKSISLLFWYLCWCLGEFYFFWTLKWNSLRWKNHTSSLKWSQFRDLSTSIKGSVWALPGWKGRKPQSLKTFQHPL